MTTPAPYEYRFEDHSVLLRLAERPVLVPLVRALPRRLTPNQITVAGHLAAAAGFAVVAVVRPITPAALAALAAAVLFYTLADCIDGLFARHSGQTSRLGELLDHWLDAVTVPLVVLSLALALPAARPLVFAAACVTAFLHVATFVHGYRVGFVHLGAVGIIEGTCIGAAACLVTAGAGPGLLGTAVVAGQSPANLLILALLAGGVSGLVGMRGLLHWLRDFGTLAVLLTTLALWYARGALAAPLAGVVAIAITSLFEGRAIRARLLRVPFKSTDAVLVLLVAGSAGLTAFLGLGARPQALLALAICAYGFGRGAIAFAGAVRLLRVTPPTRAAPAAVVTEP